MLRKGSILVRRPYAMEGSEEASTSDEQGFSNLAAAGKRRVMGKMYMKV